jgi:hypothetical protein
VGMVRDARRVRGNRVSLRAERYPNGDGRVYRVAFRATGRDGLSCEGDVRVGVRRHKHAAAADSAPPAYDSLRP